MARRYRYEGEWYEDDDVGRLALAHALVMYEPGIVDDYDFECWVDERNTASQILGMVKDWGYDDTFLTLWSDFEEWYAEENTEDLLRDFSASYDIVDDDEEEEEEEEE